VKRYKLILPQDLDKYKRPPSKLSEQLEKNYAERKGLKEKPYTEPELDKVYAKILKDMECDMSIQDEDQRNIYVTRHGASYGRWRERKKTSKRTLKQCVDSVRRSVIRWHAQRRVNRVNEETGELYHVFYIIYHCSDKSLLPSWVRPSKTEKDVYEEKISAKVI
tara:strand:+ start:550 stop:1041 length:492 start_codon:yes stop_codon:yes gene_type:complete